MPELATGQLLASALSVAARRLAGAGCETSRLDAELLLGETLGVGRARLVLDAGRGLDAHELETFDGLLSRREAREPIAYILGRKEFRHITLAVDSRVLIPRPETELLVEVGVQLPTGARVIDVGTGSGAVALALKHERPDLEVSGSDVSEAALAVARANGERLGLDVRWVRADLLAGVPGGFDAVLANPPYVADDADLAPEIVRYEPAQALFAGADGLQVIRRLVPAVRDVPVVAVEVGAGQAAAVVALMSRAGFAAVDVLPDLAGHERVVVARQ